MKSLTGQKQKKDWKNKDYFDYWLAENSLCFNFNFHLDILQPTKCEHSLKKIEC